MYPRIYLAIDNCFASKRYTRPMDWMRVTRDMGVYQIEASADTECDPLYMGAEYMARWKAEVARAAGETGQTVRNLYSGHGTYATLGLMHTDAGARAYFRDNWIKRQAALAGELGAGFGFFAHGVDISVLNDVREYRAAYERLVDDLSDVAASGLAAGAREVGLEQMYSPHQIPFTVPGARRMVAEVYAARQAPMYLTIDVGHMNGQRRFVMPDANQVSGAIEAARRGEPVHIYLGPDAAYRAFERAVRSSGGALSEAERVCDEMDAYPHMFAEYSDGSVEHWLAELGAYAPIVHLQQSDGKSSPHWNFTRLRNASGIIDAPAVLRALKAAYDAPVEPDMPPRVDEIALTLEPFISTAADVREDIKEITESVAYWRGFVPEDGMALDELCARLD